MKDISDGHHTFGVSYKINLFDILELEKTLEYDDIEVQKNNFIFKEKSNLQ